jgi:hypothetical protein
MMEGLSGTGKMMIWRTKQMMMLQMKIQLLIGLKMKKKIVVE